VLLGVSGFNALVASSHPAGAGLSSSAALEVALAKALQKAFTLPLDAMSLDLVLLVILIIKCDEKNGHLSHAGGSFVAAVALPERVDVGEALRLAL